MNVEHGVRFTIQVRLVLFDKVNWFFIATGFLSFLSNVQRIFTLKEVLYVNGKKLKQSEIGLKVISKPKQNPKP